MEFSNSNIKEFFKRKLFLYFRKRKPQKNFFYILKRKLVLYFGKRNPKNILSFTGNGTFLWFRKRKPLRFLMFQEIELSELKN